MSDQDLLITGCTIIDPATGTVDPGILSVAAGRMSESTAVDGVTHLDGSGLFAVPGLIDMHVHTTSDPIGRTAARWADMSPTTMTLSAVDNLGSALHSGVTTVRDLGATDDLGYQIKAAWSRRLFVGARPLVAGPVITAIGGHGTWSGVESEGESTIGGLVRRNVSMGSDVVKLMMRSAARRTELRPREITAAVEEAHWLGVPVAVHANFSERSIDTAVEAGCDTLEHGFAISATTAAAMAAQGTALCATTVALRSIVDNPGPWVRRGGQDLVDRAVSQFADARRSFEAALGAGVPIIAGTDAGVTGVGFDSLARELESMVEWGASPQQALAAATCTAALHLGHPELGTLEAGTPADIVLLRGNPLIDISACHRIEAVVQDGRLVRLDSPSRLLTGAVSSPPGSVLPPQTCQGS